MELRFLPDLKILKSETDLAGNLVGAFDWHLGNRIVILVFINISYSCDCDNIVTSIVDSTFLHTRSVAEVQVG